jgi:hypothetical protein
MIIDIRKRKNELLEESWRLREAGFELLKNQRTRKDPNYDKIKELHKKQDEVWKKKEFFEKYLKEMEKIGK